jgi:hypothetical protein
LPVRHSPLQKLGDQADAQFMGPIGYEAAYAVKQGRRYRLKFRNASDDIHSLHLHRHSFEPVRVGGKPTAGVIKDVVMLGGFQEVESTGLLTIPDPRCSTATSSCTWIR